MAYAFNNDKGKYDLDENILGGATNTLYDAELAIAENAADIADLQNSVSDYKAGVRKPAHNTLTYSGIDIVIPAHHVCIFMLTEKYNNAAPRKILVSSNRTDASAAYTVAYASHETDDNISVSGVLSNESNADISLYVFTQESINASKGNDIFINYVNIHKF